MTHFYDSHLNRSSKVYKTQTSAQTRTQTRTHALDQLKGVKTKAEAFCTTHRRQVIDAIGIAGYASIFLLMFYAAHIWHG